MYHASTNQKLTRREKETVSNCYLRSAKDREPAKIAKIGNSGVKRKIKWKVEMTVFACVRQ